MASERATAPSGATSGDVDALIQRIATEYAQLSKQLKLIAKYVELHRDHIGLEGILEVAANCGVQPSAIVRFAKHFGYSGFSELQGVFRSRLQRQLVSRNYQARIRDVIQTARAPLSNAQIATEFIGGSIAAMRELQAQLDTKAFDRAVTMLQKADAIWVLGSRRSFAIAAYLDYALQQTDKRVGLISALASMQLGQARSIRRDDVVLTISFTPYAPETLAVVEEARARGAKIIAITDSRMGQLPEQVDCCLVVQDSTNFGFRSLTSTMALAQSLFIALAYRLELGQAPGS